MFDPSSSEPRTAPAAGPDGRPYPDGATEAAPPAPTPEPEEAMMGCRVTVRCAWDEAAGLYVVSDSSLPGLAAQGPTMQALMCDLPGNVRDLLGLAPDAYIDVFIERVTR